MDELEIYCKFNEADKLTVIQDRNGELLVEIKMADSRSYEACVYLTTETAQQLAEALINWVNEQ